MRLLVLAVVAAVSGGSVVAIPTESQHQKDLPDFKPIEFVVGSCWIGTFPNGKETDEHCFEWIYGGRFLRDSHVVRGDSVPYEGETTYAWDAQQKRIVYWYIALPGFFSHGQVDATDGALVFRDNLVMATPRQLRTTWRKSGADGYTVLVEEVTNGNSKELWSMAMQRSRRTSPE